MTTFSLRYIATKQSFITNQNELKPQYFDLKYYRKLFSIPFTAPKWHCLGVSGEVHFWKVFILGYVSCYISFEKYSYSRHFSNTVFNYCHPDV